MDEGVSGYFCGDLAVFVTSLGVCLLGDGFQLIKVAIE